MHWRVDLKWPRPFTKFIILAHLLQFPAKLWKYENLKNVQGTTGPGWTSELWIWTIACSSLAAQLQVHLRATLGGNRKSKSFNKKDHKSQFYQKFSRKLINETAYMKEGTVYLQKVSMRNLNGKVDGKSNRMVFSQDSAALTKKLCNLKKTD